MTPRSRHWLWLLLAPLAACGGSGDDTSAASPAGSESITGIVLAPGGTVAPVSKPGAAATGVMQPVSQARVLAFRIDRAGNAQGLPVAETTTDAQGRFVLSGIQGEVRREIVIQATSLQTPQSVGLQGTGVLNSPVTGDDIRLDPASEAATRRIVDQLRAAQGSTLSNFTEREAASFVDYVQTILTDDPARVQTDTESTIDELDEAPLRVRVR